MLIVLSIDTGMRVGETQALRHKDLSLVWKVGAIQRGELTVQDRSGYGPRDPAFGQSLRLPFAVARTLPQSRAG